MNSKGRGDERKQERMIEQYQTSSLPKHAEEIVAKFDKLYSIYDTPRFYYFLSHIIVSSVVIHHRIFY